MTWAALLNSVNLGEGPWTAEKVAINLSGPIWPEHIFFLACGGEPVATACIHLHQTAKEPQVEVGWVAVRPDHRGKHLGYWVCLGVLHKMHQMGFSQTYLVTEDHRLPALKTYLNLGFVPDCRHESHPKRWEQIYKFLYGSLDADRFSIDSQQAKQ